MKDHQRLSAAALAILSLFTGLAALSPTSRGPAPCFNWQAVIRDKDGKPMDNRSLTFEISIIEDDGGGAGNGAIVYSEQHTSATNQFGLISLPVGCGDSPSGDLTSLQWDAAEYWISIKGDPDGQLASLGKSRIMAAPWAAWARRSGDWVNIGDSVIRNNAGMRFSLETDEPKESFQIGDRWTFHNGGTKYIGYNTYYGGTPRADRRITDDEASSLRFNGDGSIFMRTSSYGPADSVLSWNGAFHLHNEGHFNFQYRSTEPRYVGYFIKEGAGAGYLGFIRSNDPANTDQRRTYFAFNEDQFSINSLKPNVRQVSMELDATAGRIQFRSPLVDIMGHTRTKILEITGGSDLTEGFAIRPAKKRQPEPGLLVSIDPDHPGQLMVAEEPYDKKLAGVISGANGVHPGMIMGQKGSVADGDYPVALTGRVYVRADASYGAIQPGDLLTSSATPGYAMKVTDYARGQGAAIGKAMTGLAEGQGYVLVLVNLQ